MADFPENVNGPIDFKAIKATLAQMMERYNFNSVHLFVTYKGKDGDTVGWNIGRGDWYARYGHVSLWADSQKKDDWKDPTSEEEEP